METSSKIRLFLITSLLFCPLHQYDLIYNGELRANGVCTHNKWVKTRCNFKYFTKKEVLESKGIMIRSAESYCLEKNWCTAFQYYSLGNKNFYTYNKVEGLTDYKNYAKMYVPMCDFQPKPKISVTHNQVIKCSKAENYFRSSLKVSLTFHQNYSKIIKSQRKRVFWIAQENNNWFDLDAECQFRTIIAQTNCSNAMSQTIKYDAKNNINITSKKRRTAFEINSASFNVVDRWREETNNSNRKMTSGWLVSIESKPRQTTLLSIHFMNEFQLNLSRVSYKFERNQISFGLDELLDLPKSVKLQIKCKNLSFSKQLQQSEQLVPKTINPFLTYQFTVQYYYAAKPVGEKVKILIFCFNLLFYSIFR